MTKKNCVIWALVIMITSSCTQTIMNKKELSQTNPNKAHNMVIIENNKAHADIIIPENASNSVREAATLLSDYVLKSCGVKVDVKEENTKSTGRKHIYVGNTQYFKKLNIDITHLGDQGFIINFPNQKSIVITGQTDIAIEFGVYEFLERYLGVRWLFPGDLGDHIPKHKTLAIEKKNIEQKPAFISRLLSPHNIKLDNSLYHWNKHNRMHGNVSFHHNLGKLFNPKKYLKTHPEYYPIINNKRRKPKVLLGWQPCFTAKGSVEEAAKNIISLFKHSPQRTSVSLGVNDNSGFCECAKCDKLNGNKKNSLGKPSKSEAYYKWCNDVAEKVLAEYPQKHFGLLAYDDVIDPPENIKLNSHIIPYSCYDRMQWLDEKLEAKGKQQHKAWTQQAEVLGWYDYIYGDRFYIIPRVYFHQMAKHLRYGYKNKLRCYYAEAYPSKNWREGPKFYVLLKLLWNPDQNVDKLLHEWCEAAVGKKATASLLAYFQLWEKYWTERIPKSEWFKNNSNNVFLPFRGYGYLASLTEEDVKTAEQLLRDTARDAGTQKEKLRAQMFLDAFLSETKDVINNHRRFLALNKTKHKSKKIIDQSDFSSSQNGWKTWQRTYSKARLCHNSSEGHTQSGCLEFGCERSVKSPICFYKDFPIQDGKIYRLSASVKHENLSKNASVKLTMKWKDQDRKWIINRMNKADIRPLEREVDCDSEDSIWKKTEIVFESPADDAAYAACLISVDNADKGKVYIDDIVFEEVVP